MSTETGAEAMTKTYVGYCSNETLGLANGRLLVIEDNAYMKSF